MLAQVTHHMELSKGSILLMLKNPHLEGTRDLEKGNRDRAGERASQKNSTSKVYALVGKESSSKDA